MAKFKFKLDSVLKLREFKEKKVMNEIAEIVKQIEAVKTEISDIHKAIDKGYQSQELLKDTEAKGQHLSFYPFFFKGKKEHLNNAESQLAALNKKYHRKIEEYAEAKGEVKVIEKLKEKAHMEFKKEQEKRIEQNREEFVITQMKRRSKEGLL